MSFSGGQKIARAGSLMGKAVAEPEEGERGLSLPQRSFELTLEKFRNSTLFLMKPVLLFLIELVNRFNPMS